MIEDFQPDKSRRNEQSEDSFEVESSVPSFGLESKPRLSLPAKVKHHHQRFKEWFAGLSKKQKILFLAAVVAVTAVLFGGLAWALSRDTSGPATTPLPARPMVTETKPLTVASTLTGLQVDPAVNKRPVTGVMIENSIFARPQSGLDQAGVVFEAIAEGGITRFLALYQDTSPSYLGPVRSARPYYVQWCQGFDCAYAHVGGSPEALQNIKDWKVKDLNQFFGASYFHRIGSRDAPHNVYTSIASLNKFEKAKGFGEPSYTGFVRAEKEGKANVNDEVAHSITFQYPGSAYDVRYTYDSDSNSYKRSEGGESHKVVDSKGKATRLTPKVVIGLGMNLTQNGKYSVYRAVGKGEAYIFQNGTVIKANWNKASAKQQIVFTDDNGDPIKLNPGQTWISALGSLSLASYK
jgi:hypothetical protein